MIKCSYDQAHKMAAKKVGKPYRTGEWQYECIVDGATLAKVTIPDPHGSKTALLKPGTIKGILSQLHLTTDEFEKWRDCSMSKEDYRLLLIKRHNLKGDGKEDPLS
jgi:hypothetical protein